MKVVYIAGKFRGPTAWHIERNIRRAEEAGMHVEAEETEAAAMASERIAADIRALGSAPRRPGGEGDSGSLPSQHLPAEEKKP